MTAHHNHITRDIKPLGQCPACDAYHDKQIPTRKYLEYPAVIDWLQWGEFPEKLGDINYPQVTLTMIAEMKQDLKLMALELVVKNKTVIDQGDEIGRLNNKYDYQLLVKENEKLREQVKDYEGVLKEYADMNDYYGRPESAREVLEKHKTKGE